MIFCLLQFMTMLFVLQAIREKIKTISADQGQHEPMSPEEMVAEQLASINDIFNRSGPRAVYQDRWRMKHNLRMQSPEELRAISDVLAGKIDRDGPSGGAELFRCVVNSVQAERVNKFENIHEGAGSAPLSSEEWALLTHETQPEKMAPAEAQLNAALLETFGETLNYPDATDEERDEKRKQYCRVAASGDAKRAEIERDSTGRISRIRYGDHVTRTMAHMQNRDEFLHTFVIPELGDPRKFLRVRVSELGANGAEVFEQATREMSSENKRVFTQTLEKFAFERWEDKEQGYTPITILPYDLNFTSRDFNKRADGTFQTEANVLHLPVKLPTIVVDRLNAEGRRLPDGQQFRDDEFYIPEVFANAEDVIRLLKQSVILENHLDGARFKENYVLLSLRAAVLEPGHTLGMGGWHSDGPQGCERVQVDGYKTPIDRAYTISNLLPTAVTDLRLDLGPVREQAARDGWTLNQYNMQDIIERTIQKAEAAAHTVGKSIIKYATPNTIQYLNPTMLHMAQQFTGPVGTHLERSFMRILYTQIPRDRLGDSVNTVLGPIYDIKIKQLVDIIQWPDEIPLAYEHPGVPDFPASKKKPSHQDDFGLEDAMSGSEAGSGIPLCLDCVDQEPRHVGDVHAASNKAL